MVPSMLKAMTTELTEQVKHPRKLLSVHSLIVPTMDDTEIPTKQLRESIIVFVEIFVLINNEMTFKLVEGVQ